jgi:hypothetical protein
MNMELKLWYNIMDFDSCKIELYSEHLSEEEGNEDDN